MLHILRSYNAKSNYMARYACRPIPPRPEGRGFSGFPVINANLGGNEAGINAGFAVNNGYGDQVGRHGYGSYR